MTRSPDGGLGTESARCVTVNVTPPMTIVPVRSAPLSFALTA
jgi:hypothetical protein